MCPKDCAYIVERLAIRFMALVADHSRQLTEHRAAFGARTEADAKIIAGLRSEIVAARMAVLERDSLISERDGLLIQAQDMRAEMQRLSAQLDCKQHPVKAGEWVKASNGAVAQVLEVHKDWYLISRGHGWTFANCEPCDQPATHDTEAGKAVADQTL